MQLINPSTLNTTLMPHSIIHGDAYLAYFNKIWGIPLPKRWIVKRTLAWLNRCRKLTKDWENLNRTALAFLRLASIRLMLRKLCNPH